MNGRWVGSRRGHGKGRRQGGGVLTAAPGALLPRLLCPEHAGGGERREGASGGGRGLSGINYC